MTYNPNIPQASDKISQSQSDILTNFTQLDLIFDNDHFKYSAGANNGFHRQVQFPTIPTPPVVAGVGSALYTAADAGGKTQLFFKNFLQTIQVTGVTGTLAAATNSFITLPGGIIVAWGTDTGASSGSGVYSINLNGASGVTFTNVFIALLNPVNSQTNSTTPAMMNWNLPASGTYQNRGFDQNHIYYFSASGSNKAVNWIAIGN